MDQFDKRGRLENEGVLLSVCEAIETYLARPTEAALERMERHLLTVLLGIGTLDPDDLDPPLNHHTYERQSQ